MNPTPHVPERSCVACRRKRPQAEFLRLTRTPAGWALVTGARTGRGAYLCADSPECWQERRLRRAFRDRAGTVAAALVERATGQPVSEQPVSGPSESHHREKPMHAQ